MTVKHPPRRSPSQPNTAARIAELLRQEILQRGEGDFLGSEEDLLKRYGVSRPTFRQTVRLMEQEQLLTVKRGIGGGYYVRKPSIEAVGRAAASYLQSRNTSHEDVLVAANTAGVTMARLAAQSTDEDTRAEMAAMMAHLDKVDYAHQPFARFLADDHALRSLIARLANNNALELFLSTLEVVAMDDATTRISQSDRPDRRRAWHRQRQRLVEAILNREPEVAAALTTCLHQQIQGWRAEDLIH